MIDELETVDSFVCRSDFNDNICEFTSTTGLFLEYFTVLYSAFDGLFIVNLRSTLIDFHAKLSLETVYDDFEVKFTHTADDCLACIMITLNSECRVLFSKFSESDTELVKVFLSLGLNCKTDNRVGECHGFENDREVFFTDGITCTKFLETYCCTNITCFYKIDRILFV